MQFKGFSRRTFLRGVAASGAMIRIGLPPLEAMTPVKKVEPAIRLLVQWQRHSRKVLDPARNRVGLRNNRVPEAARALPQRYSRDHRPR